MSAAGTGGAGRTAAPVRTAAYVHTPFCAIKCAYCSFFSHERGAGQGAVYFEGLEAELAHRRRAGTLEGRLFDTLYLGGGTPTALEPAELRRLFALLREHLVFAPGVDMTSEANPESLTPANAALLRELGVNRLSLGAQSFHDDELRRLNRPHDAAAIGAAVRTARAAGFADLSLDLIYGLPHQTLARWQATVEAALALQPDHLSCYCLILEPGTPLASAVRDRREAAPDEDLQRDMFDWLRERLAAAGFAMYELSNYARPGRESAHNLYYWTGRPFVGLGPSAHSGLAGRRGANPAHLEHYRTRFTAAVVDEPLRPVEPAHLRFERIFMALRLVEGLKLSAFAAEFGAPLDDFHPGLVDRLVARGWLIRAGDFLRLHPDYYFLSDGVFSEFAP